MKLLYNTSTQQLQPYPRDDDGEVIGLDPVYEVFDVIQSPQPDVTDGYLLRATEAINIEAKTVTRGFEIVAIDLPPAIVTLRSFSLACGRTLWNSILAAVEAIPDEDQKWEAQQYVQRSPTVSRNHPLVLQLAAALDQTAAQVDAIFAAAKLKDEAP